MIEKKSAHDKSKSSYTIGVGKSKSNSKRAGKDTPQEFELTSGLPKGGYDKDGARLKHDNPSHEGEVWFRSKSFNDVESNKRPLHPDKDYLNPHDDQTSDDHIEKHGMEGKEKVNWSENPNNDTKAHKKGGYLKVKRDGWTGNDHLNKKIDAREPDEELPFIGYAPINPNLEKKPNIYNITEIENIKDMKKFNEQLDRIQQIILFEEGMTYKDVQKLTEGHGEEGEGFAAAEPAGQPGIMRGDSDKAFTTTWGHSVDGSLTDTPENIYAVYTQDGRVVEPDTDRAGNKVYSGEQLATASDTEGGGRVNVYRGVSGKKGGLTYSTPTAGTYGLAAPDGKVFTVTGRDSLYGGTSDSPWYWGAHGETASDDYGVTYSEFGTEADYTSANQAAADAASWWGQAGHSKGGKGEVGKVMSDYGSEADYNRAVWAQQDTNLDTTKAEMKARTIRKGPKLKSGLGSGAVGAPFGSPSSASKSGKGGKGKKDKALSENKKIMKNRKVIKLTEEKLRNVIKRAIAGRPKKLTLQERVDKQFSDARKVLREHRGHLFEKDWMQKADDDIEKRGTEGVFHKFCVDNGFEDGCSKGCWDKAKEKGGVWGRRAGLAKAFCDD